MVNYFDLNGYQYRISEHDEDGVNSINLCLFIEEDEVLINDHNNKVTEDDDGDDDDDDNGHKKKKIKIKEKKRHTLGTLDGKLVRRGINFDRDMDYISQETCQAIHYFDIMGKVGEKICSLLGNDKKIIKKANGKYLLYVEELRVKDKERGKDLSLHLMEALFYYFQDDFSLCMLFPGPSIYNNNNNDYNRNERDDDDDTNEEVKQKHREKQDKVIIKLGRHFARLGFRQIDKNGYWIVNKPILPPLNKSETAGLEVLLDYPTYFRIVKLDEKEKELRNIIESPFPSVSDIKQYIDNNDMTIDMINKTCIFHCAVVYEYKDIMNYLINLGIDINYVDDLGNSPLHLAVMYGLDQIGIQLLLSGANKNVYDIEGKLPKQLLQEKRALGKRFNRCFYIENSEETSYEEAFRIFLA